MLDSDASTAKTLTLAAIVLQLAFMALWFLVFFTMLLFGSFLTTTTTTGTGTTVSVAAPGVFAFGFFSIFFLFGFAAGVVWILLDYFLIYSKLAEEKVEEAETPCLVLSIIQLVLGGVIGGVLLLIAYIKIRDSIGRRRQMQTQVQTMPHA